MRCVKTRKKNVFLVTLYPQGVYFLLFRLRNPLSAHTRTHGTVSQHPPCPFPPFITRLSEGLPGKMAAFQTAHSVWRDNALIAEVRRPRAHQNFRHASAGFSICIPNAFFFFFSLCWILRLQTKWTSSKHLLALKLVSHPRFRIFFPLRVLPYEPHRGDFTLSEILCCQHMSLAINLSHGAISLG